MAYTIVARFSKPKAFFLRQQLGELCDIVARFSEPKATVKKMDGTKFQPP
jgi:hypothetical protein